MLVFLADQLSNGYQIAQREMGNFSPEPFSVGDLFAGALLPGLALVGMYIVYQLFVAFTQPHKAPPMRDDGSAAPSFSQIMHALVPPIALIIAVLGSILVGIATPTEAAAVGAVGALLLAGYRVNQNKPWPVYMAVFSLVVVLVLTSFMDLRVARNVIPTGDMVGIWIAGLACAVLAYGLLVSLYRVFAGNVLVPVMQSTTQITCMVFVILIGATFFSLIFRDLGGRAGA